MGQRYWSQFQLCNVKGLVEVYAAVAFDAANAPTLQRFDYRFGYYVAAPTGGADGVTSITRNSTGNYTVVLQDKYQRLLAFDLFLLDSANTTIVGTSVKPGSDPTAAAAAVSSGLTTNNTFIFQTYTATATVGDVATTVMGVMHIVLANVSVT